MKIMKGATQVAAALGFSVLLSGVSYASPSGTITVTNPGPLGATVINASVFNGTSGQIEKLTFDLSGTHCTNGLSCILGEPMVYNGGLAVFFPYDPLANGTLLSAIPGGVRGLTVFSFDFTGFDPLDIFKFNFTVSGASSHGFGFRGIIDDLAGTVITASVRFSATEVLTYSGTMAIVGHDVAANLAPVPVPEPETYAMLLAGLGLIGFAGYRRKQAAAV